MQTDRIKIMEINCLYLREMTPADAAPAYYLNLDPEVAKYISDLALKSIGEAKTFLEN